MLVPWPVGHAQDQPSLGDVARQARKDKEKNTTPAKTVVTDDNLPSSTSKGLGAVDLSGVAGSKTAGRAADAANVNAALAGLAQGEAALDKLEPMDRATLARAVLSNNNVDFAGRSVADEELLRLAFDQVERAYYKQVDPQTIVNGERSGLLWAERVAVGVGVVGG